MTVLKDAPSTFGAYSPENFDGRFVGPLTAQDALIRSRNIPAVFVASQLSKPDLYDFLSMAGVSGLQSKQHYGLALVLGGGELTMEELVTLYGALSNEGVVQAVRYRADVPERRGMPVLSPEAAWVTLDMLKANPRPDAPVAAAPGRLPVYWKTGTSYGFRDAWTVGIFGPYVLAVWVGNFDGEGNPAFVGVQMAAPLLFPSGRRGRGARAVTRGATAHVSRQSHTRRCVRRFRGPAERRVSPDRADLVHPGQVPYSRQHAAPGPADRRSDRPAGLPAVCRGPRPSGCLRNVELGHGAALSGGRTATPRAAAIRSAVRTARCRQFHGAPAANYVAPPWCDVLAAGAPSGHRDDHASRDGERRSARGLLVRGLQLHRDLRTRSHRGMAPGRRGVICRAGGRR